MNAPRRQAVLDIVKDGLNDEERQALINKLKSLGETDTDISSVLTGGQIVPATSTGLDFENELKAVAQGAVSGLTLGIYKGPEFLRPEESRLKKYNFLSFGPFSPSRLFGEVASSAVPFGLASKVGRAVLGFTKIAKGLEAATVGGSALTRAGKYLLRPEVLEREVGASILMGGGEIADQAIKTGKVDWKSVGEDAALGAIMGIALSPAAEKILGKGVKGYQKLFEKLPEEAIEKASTGLKKKLDERELIQITGPELHQVRETGFTRRQVTTPEKRISSRELQDMQVDQWVAQREIKVMNDVREEGITIARKLKIPTTDFFDNAQVFAGIKKNITMDDLHKTQAWIKTQRKYEKLGLGDVRLKGETTTEAQLRGMTPKQLEREALDIGRAKVAKRTRFLELPAPRPSAVTPAVSTKKSRETVSYAQKAMKKFTNAVQALRDLDQTLYKNDLKLIKRVREDSKAGIPIQKAVLEVYKDALGRMGGSEAKSLSRIQ